MAGQYRSGVTAAAAADTAQQLETSNGTKFAYALFSLHASASGICRIGDSSVKLSTAIGASLKAGDTLLWPAVPQAMNAHFTEQIWVTFTGNTANDLLSWTLVKN